MMIISNICHIIHRCSRSNIGDHRGLLGHSFICVAANIQTMQNSFFHSLKIGKIARIAKKCLKQNVSQHVARCLSTENISKNGENISYEGL